MRWKNPSTDNVACIEITRPLIDSEEVKNQKKRKWQHRHVERRVLTSKDVRRKFFKQKTY